MPVETDDPLWLPASHKVPVTWSAVPLKGSSTMPKLRIKGPYPTTAPPECLTRVGYPIDPEQHGLGLPLHSDLYLVACDDDTGCAHIDDGTLTWGSGRRSPARTLVRQSIRIGWMFNARTGYYDPDPGRITVTNVEPLGEPLADSALTMLWQTGGPTTSTVSSNGS